jgi:L-rhamnose mutarotase
MYEKMREEVTRSDYKMFQFVFYRVQTRYKQKNYQKYSYKVENEEKEILYTLSELLNISAELEYMGFQTTRNKWGAKNQRNLMTSELREKIKKRDNYTCQICGKYMPDEVGLHIDHIISIKNGGKSVESNLQVLCDKCNLRKK